MPIDLPNIQPPSVTVVVANDATMWGVGKKTQGVFVGATGEYDFGPVYVTGEINNADYGVGANSEVIGTVGVKKRVLGFDLGSAVEYHKLSDSHEKGDQSVYVDGSVAHSFGPITLGVQGTYAPQDFGNQHNNWYVEGDASYRFGKNTLSGGYGHKGGNFIKVVNHDLEIDPVLLQEGFDPCQWQWACTKKSASYNAWNLGLSRDLTKTVSVDARYYSTDQTDFGHTYRNHWVGTLSVKF